MTILLDVADVSKLFPVGGGPGPLARFKRRFSGGPEKLPKVYAVDDVSFTINKGETVGLVGEFRLRQVDLGAGADAPGRRQRRQHQARHP